MDFVTAWKAVSIALTGAFGILGLLKDYKDKVTQKVTLWGKISLTGIILSTVLGVAAQLKESSDGSAKALEMAKKSDLTLREIGRVLFPLSEPTISANFDVMCPENEKVGMFCKERSDAYWKNIGNEKTESANKIFAHWPGNHPVKFMLQMDFYVTSKYHDPPYGFPYEGDWHLESDSSLTDKPTRLGIGVDKYNGVEFGIANQKPSKIGGTGSFLSITDFAGSTVIFRLIGDDNNFLKLTDFELTFKNGQTVRCEGPFQQYNEPPQREYIYTFPTKEN
ncbi:MAG TPA: hypothetical protein VGI45_24875 [Terracidiphilus sp.]|jgi:hypothetical protein